MKELLTVNNDFTSCEVGTFEYNQDNCKNLELISIVSSYIEDNGIFKNSAKKMLTILGTSFKEYTEEIIKHINKDSKAVLTNNDSNISVEFDLDSLGTKEQPIAVTCINYIMNHEHDLIDDYINGNNITAVQYINGYFDDEKNSYVSNWSTDVIKTDVIIDKSKFYAIRKTKSGAFEVQRVSSRNYMTDNNGHVNYAPIKTTAFSYKKVELGRNLETQYIAPDRPIFHDTSMCIEDFRWDPDNNKHHFIFNSDRKLLQVPAKYSYLLDDDYGDGGDKLITRSYYLGPSFTVIK